MNITSMTNHFRRRVHDLGSSPQWSDADVLELLNAGYQQVQKEILKVDSEPWVNIGYVDQTLNLQWIPRPTDTWWETEVAVADTQYQDGYRPLERMDAALTPTRPASSNQVWDRRGQYIYVNPKFTNAATVTNGIRIVYVPVLSLSTQVPTPIIPVPLHMSIVYWAHLLAVGESDEAADKIRQGLQDILGDLSIYYYRHGSKPDSLILDIDNGHGLRGTNDQPTVRSRWTRGSSIL